LLEESWIKPKRYIPQYNAYNNESHILNFHFKEEISSGDYLLIMNFTGSLNDNNESIFKNSYVDSTGHKTWVNSEHKNFENMYVLSLYKTLLITISFCIKTLFKFYCLSYFYFNILFLRKIWILWNEMYMFVFERENFKYFKYFEITI